MQFSDDQINRILSGEHPAHVTVCFHGFQVHPLKDGCGHTHSVNLRFIGHEMTSDTLLCQDEDQTVPESTIRITDYPLPAFALDDLMEALTFVRLVITPRVGDIPEEVMEVFREEFEKAQSGEEPTGNSPWDEIVRRLNGNEER